MISPRLGFNWNPSASGKDQVRGGIGVFAGRTPFVWISNAYGGTGIEITGLSASNVPFNPDPNNPPKNFPPGTAAVSVDTVDPEFKFPQVLRTHPGLRPRAPVRDPRDRRVHVHEDAGGRLLLQQEQGPERGHDVLRTRPSTRTSIPGSPTSPSFPTPPGASSRTSIVQLEKRFPFGLYVNGSYAYMNAKAAFEATSSVAYSNWQFQTTDGNIDTQQLTRSFFEVPHRFNLVVSEAFKTGPLLHNVGLVYFAQSGQPYSILMGGDPNNDGGFSNDQIFVPENYSDVVWKSGTAGVAPPTEDQWNTFLSTTGLDKYRGCIAPRNALDAPWIHTLDFHYDITLPISVVQVQLTFDVLNLINLLNSNSGLLRYVNFQTYTALNAPRPRRGHGQADLHGQLGRARRGEAVQHERPPLALPAEVGGAPFVLARTRSIPAGAPGLRLRRFFLEGCPSRVRTSSREPGASDAFAF